MVMEARAVAFDSGHSVRVGSLSNRLHRGGHVHAFQLQPDATGRVSRARTRIMIETIQWTDSGVVMIDQTRLPREELYVTCTDHFQVAEAIRSMVIRGAPAIGVAAAMGIALGMRHAQSSDEFGAICETIRATRPTAVNLFWAIDRMRRVFAESSALNLDTLRERLIAEAIQIRLEDIAINECIGRNGAPLIPDGKTVLTHCNAGALATAGYGTALGVIRAAVASGKHVDVFADETRPFLQGARLTIWELQHDNIPATLITDNMAGHFLHSGRIGCVVVGADRIASNGDVANKIGTYSLAVLAKENNVPFYVAAPVSTFDLTLKSGDAIPIEQRAADEVTHVFGVHVAPENIAVENPAFDVTPARYITAIISERGVARAPYEGSLRRLAESRG